MHRQLQRIPVTAGLLSLVLLLPAPALAQEGVITGIVRDTSGAVLPGATVEARSPALIERVRSTTTESNGQYRFLALPVGVYELTFSLPSFNSLRRENINVTTGFTATISVELGVGGLAETVTVTADPPTVDVTSARTVVTFTGEDLRELPTSRNLSSLMVLVPGLSYSQNAAGINEPGGVCVGGAGTWCSPNVGGFNVNSTGDAADLAQGQLRIDGQVINTASPTIMGIMNGYLVDVANAQEISFNLSGALGESETGGASINIVPRTGGNSYRGTYTTTYTTQSWFDRNNRTRGGAAVNNLKNDYDVSGSFGGPVLRDRLWFHTVLRRQGKETQPGGQPFYYNKNAGIWAAPYQPDRARGTLTYTNLWQNANARITLQATPRNKINLFWDEQESCLNPCGGAVSSTWSPEANWSVRNQPNRLWQAGWTNPLTNRLLLEGRLNVVHQHFDFTKHKYEQNYWDIPAVSEAATSGCCVGRDEVDLQVHTSVGTTHAGGFGCTFGSAICSGSIASSNLNRLGNARPTLSAAYVTAAHNLKVGWEGQIFWQNDNIVVNGPQMRFNMTSPPASCINQASPELSTCGTPHPLFAASDPYNLERRPRPVSLVMHSGPTSYKDRLTTHALYVQDQWTVSRFTVNAALRYDHARSNYLPTCMTANVFVSEEKAWCTEPNDGVRFHDISPRWGVAWDVFGDGKTAIKWNMGRYLQAARFTGVYADSNLGRNSLQTLTRTWTDNNGDRLVDCDLLDQRAQGPTVASATTIDACGAANAQNLALFGGSPAFSFGGTFFCGQQQVKEGLDYEGALAWAVDYCDRAGQDLYQGWGARRNEWQFGLGIQRELLPRLSAEITYNQRWFRNLQVTDTVGLGCDLYSGATTQCQADMLDNFVAPIDPVQGMQQWNFYRAQAPLDPRLPNGGGYWVVGQDTRGTFEPLPSGQSVATFQSYNTGWRGINTNFVLRARGGIRLNGGTNTGASFSNTCPIMVNSPTGNVRRMAQIDEAGNIVTQNRPQCYLSDPWQTNVRGSISYTIPKVDVLVSSVFQSLPGPNINANMTYRIMPAEGDTTPLIVWERGHEWRATNTETCTPTFTTGPSAGQPHPAAVGCFMESTAQTVSVNLLDQGDRIYGSRYNVVDLKLAKNIRFARRRVNIGVDIYNLVNSDAVTGYNGTYNPQTWEDEHGNVYFGNPWRSATQLLRPRFARVSLQFDF